MDFGMTLWGEAASATELLTMVWRVVLVLIGINALIIVHEWGHFIVARLCGVRCEKFYIWFDAWGFRFFRFKWGQTEYGLGWLPLGGYVKMLGQEDNPAAIKEEIERAKKTAETLDADNPEGAAAAAELEELHQNLFARDSFLSKNVFQRMAIISAGVCMNVVFAIVCAAGAAMIGFPETTSRIGTVFPATPAWVEGLRAGDEIVEMNGRPITLFSQIPYSLINGATASVKIQRYAAAEPIERSITPKREKDGLMPVIGVLPATSLRLANLPRPYKASLDAAEEAALRERFGSLAAQDRLVSMNDRSVETPADYERFSREWIDAPITCGFVSSDTLARARQNESLSPEKTITVPPVRAAECGVRLTMGEITAIQVDSPATEAGLIARSVDEHGAVTAHGDVIVSIDNEPVTDPLALPYLLDCKAARRGVSVVLSVRRGGELVDIPVNLTANSGFTGRLSYHGALASSSLGVSFEVEPIVSGLDTRVQMSGSGKALGGKIEKVLVSLPPMQGEPSNEVKRLYQSIYSYGGANGELCLNAPTENGERFGSDLLDWFTKMFNELPEGTPLQITVRALDGSTVELSTDLRPGDGGFLIDRGLYFGVDTRRSKVSGIPEALKFGWNKTVESMGLVFRVLKNIGRNVSAKAFGGPGMIVGAAWTATGTGDGLFLLFLCVIGANLAVVNILPIPVLDGGHLVFLLYEAIFRKPANENVQVILSFIGLFLLLSLMAWVILLDIARYTGWL